MTERATIAVALAYDRGAGGAPRVVAKGKGEIGEQILALARANGVPIEENAGLAAALAGIELDDEIPVELYKAVAEVLRFILKMSGKAPGSQAE